MITFRTVSGSLYEVDTENMRARRLRGKTLSVRATPEWRKYTAISQIRIGEPVIFFWDDETPLLPGSPDGAVPTTLTGDVCTVSS